eukprot:CAMPEP_0194114400 /NCGR_PEP_ID=MMETSP0150-20130528/19997_1 /TAXON_ID=122233 /ORGANISM="Chaetoceros debilis, Strain MM31A-1" /LENGTH=959 /DNA_ID=CAMNT_0038804591 /DNA_START=208 /DNA_END=3087 /DNA_ORIENTATION=-
MTMRKQKASDKRTRRMQRNQVLENENPLEIRPGMSPTTPMDNGAWKHKRVTRSSLVNAGTATDVTPNRGRGRSRKRSAVYSNLSSYHTQFLELLTAEFLAEEKLVRDRIDSAASDSMQSLLLETAGHALFDMYPERRGNIFADEVYRLTKAHDASTNDYSVNDDEEEDLRQSLPRNSKFSQNDVIMLTVQQAGAGDFFGSTSIPTNKDAVSLEARVLNTGPTYIDVAINGGAFEATFGPAPNNRGPSGKGDKNMRLRIDRYFSNVPYNRMVDAIGQLTSVQSNSNENVDSSDRERTYVDRMIRQTILSTFAYDNAESPMHGDGDACRLNDLAKQIAKPPLQDSTRLTNQVLGFLQSNPQKLFPQFNGPQISAIGAALTRKLTMIQGPPGTGKTTVAASIAFGFSHQCRSSKNLPKYSKVLATAFSNVGADNLAEQAIRVGLKVVRVGKASAVSQGLWDHTLDAAIEKDAEAKKAMEEATRATANLRKTSLINGKKGGSRTKMDIASERNKRDLATTAVKASIEACNAAATKAMREADVIVCTSIGAADARLLAACGMAIDGDELVSEQLNGKMKSTRTIPRNPNIPVLAPDGLPPLSMPFVITDEACQSVEPGSLIPIFSTNGCKSLVMLGDPCQLPPTVISDDSGVGSSPLSISLMSRLASTLPAPVIVTAQNDKTPRENMYLNLKLTKQAASLVQYKGGSSESKVSYKKQYAGSLLLSVQYRMHPSIAAFSSAVFYDSMLSTPMFLTKERILPDEFDDILPLDNSPVSVRFINISGKNNEKRGEIIEGGSSELNSALQSSSYTNEAEAAQVISLLKDMMKNRESASDPFNGSVGVITPYTGQVILLKTMMSADVEFRAVMQKNPIMIEVNSIDSYQGRERDVILFSTVRSNFKGNVGFLSDWRRMNVAITRAKSGLIMFGDMKTLAHDRHWEAFCKWCEGVDCVFDIDPDLDEDSFE